MNRTIFVTGANGQLGHEMRRVAKSSIDRYIFTDLEELDITNSEAMMELAKREKIDIVINCAAYTNVDQAEDDQERANQINNLAVGNIARAAKAMEALLIHISTDYVFDGEANTPYKESDTTSPIGVYGTTKLAGEESIVESGCRYIIIRTSWLYSEWGNNFVKTMQHLMTERDSINVIFDQIGTPTYAGDLAEAIEKIIQSNQIDKEGIYHYSNEGVCSWYDFAHEIGALTGSGCQIRPIHSHEYPSRVSRPHYSVLDKTKFKESFEIEIPYWRESLKKLIR